MNHRATLLIPAILLLAGCLGPYRAVNDGAPSEPLDLDTIRDPVPRVEPRSRYGNPEHYTVNGRTYRVMGSSRGYSERGIASWYGTKFHGRLTSTREPYDMRAMTAAHKSLPLPTYAEVTNLENGRSVIVRINDRGPFHDNRLIDLSYAAATKLGITARGTGLVEVRAIDPHAPQGSHHTLAAGRNSIYLQLGAFQARSNAERLRERVARQASIDAIGISELHQAAQTLYRVRIGPLASVEEADRVSEALTRHGIDPPRVVID